MKRESLTSPVVLSCTVKQAKLACMLVIISAILDISPWSELNAAVESDWWRSR
jgi:hypothetical protein